MAETYKTFDFGEYIRHGEPSQREKAEAWNIAIGLQAVDGLKPSQYLLQTAQRHIEGDLTIDEVKQKIRSYYKKRTARTEKEQNEEEADKVSANITKLLASPSFVFSVAGLTSIHRHIFDGVFKFAGKIRDYDITKKEWVLDDDTVLYAPYQDLRETIAYDLECERRFSYQGLSQDIAIEHIAHFVADLWQIHPFGEGNTRTTAVFAIKYLRSLGFTIGNELFAQHSWYFRNSLVRANYRNLAKGIEPDLTFLIRFFRNVLLGENNELKNRFCHVRWKDFAPTSTPTSTPTSIPTSGNPFAEELQGCDNVVRLIQTIGSETLPIKEIMNRLQLNDRKNFIEYHLSPAIKSGFVRMLYPESPRHPRQKYLLTTKGLTFFSIASK